MKLNQLPGKCKLLNKFLNPCSTPSYGLLEKTPQPTCALERSLFDIHCIKAFQPVVLICAYVLFARVRGDGGVGVNWTASLHAYNLLSSEHICPGCHLVQLIFLRGLVLLFFKTGICSVWLGSFYFCNETFLFIHKYQFSWGTLIIHFTQNGFSKKPQNKPKLNASIDFLQNLLKTFTHVILKTVVVVYFLNCLLVYSW